MEGQKQLRCRHIVLKQIVRETRCPVVVNGNDTFAPARICPMAIA